VAELDERELPQLRNRLDTAAATLTRADEARTSARAVRDEADSAATEATRVEAAASGDVERADQRAHDLGELLRHRPDAVAAATAPSAWPRGEEGAPTTRTQEPAARHISCAGEVQQALGRPLRIPWWPWVPPLDEKHGAGWDTLMAWTREALSRVADDLGRAEEASVSSAAAVTEAEAAAVAACEAVELSIPHVAVVATTIAGALAEARGQVSLQQRIRRARLLAARRGGRAGGGRILAAENPQKQAGGSRALPRQLVNASRHCTSRRAASTD
jgi:hypothetical protein